MGRGMLWVFTKQVVEKLEFFLVFFLSVDLTVPAKLYTLAYNVIVGVFLDGGRCLGVAGVQAKRPSYLEQDALDERRLGLSTVAPTGVAVHPASRGGVKLLERYESRACPPI